MSHSFDGQSSLSPQNVSTTVYKRRFPRVGVEFYSRLYDKLTKSHECLPEGEECTPCIELATGFRGTLIESDRRTCGWPRPTRVCCMEAVRKRTREFHVVSRTRPMGADDIMGLRLPCSSSKLRAWEVLGTKLLLGRDADSDSWCIASLDSRGYEY